MRKPKIHPKYGLKLVGINFRERWNVVEFATEKEIQAFVMNTKHISDVRQKYLDSSESMSWWEQKHNIINEVVQNTYLRKLWRTRHSQSFKKDTIYRVDRNISRWNTKLGPVHGEGYATAYQYERTRKHVLNKGDLLTLTKVDEMGNLYFIKINEITAPHPYVFNRDNANLAYVVPVEV